MSDVTSRLSTRSSPPAPSPSRSYQGRPIVRSRRRTSAALALRPPVGRAVRSVSARSTPWTMSIERPSVVPVFAVSRGPATLGSVGSRVGPTTCHSVPNSVEPAGRRPELAESVETTRPSIVAASLAPSGTSR
ncbi:hypothetical protein ACFPRL_11225 [Pseudoclavibacter helvolus]